MHLIFNEKRIYEIYEIYAVHKRSAGYKYCHNKYYLVVCKVVLLYRKLQKKQLKYTIAT